VAEEEVELERMEAREENREKMEGLLVVVAVVDIMMSGWFRTRLSNQRLE
jgi:arginyl-tRNA--protein-N-Asp/Glu arginylyltransferase